MIQKLSEKTDGLALGDAFEELRSNIIVSEFNSSQIQEIALSYKYHYEESKILLGLARERAINNEDEAGIIINQIALELTYGNDPSDLLITLSDCNDKRMPIIRGYYFLLTKQDYESALFEFSKVNFQKGINICNLGLNNKKYVYETMNEILIGCIDSTKWINLSKCDQIERITNKDFLYRIGLSEVYDNPKSIDVILTNLEFEISEIKSLKEIKLRHPYIYTAEIDYIIGKIFHLNGEYDQAVQFYEMSLNYDPEYLPSKFNLSRIRGKAMEEGGAYMAIHDYNAILSVNSGKYDYDFNKCSIEIRKMALLALNAERKNTKFLDSLESAIDSTAFDRIPARNNLAVLKMVQNNLENEDGTWNVLNSKFIEEILEETIPICEDSSQVEVLKYNLGILKSDTDLLKENTLPESKFVLSYLCKDRNTSILPLQGYIHMEENPEESINMFEECIKKGYNLFAIACLSHLYLQQNDYEKVIKLTKKNPESFYSINCLAVCYAKRGYPKQAIALLKQLENDLITNNIPFIDAIYQNLANCFIICEDWTMAASNLLKIKQGSVTINALLGQVCQFVDDLKIIELCMDRCPGLEEIKAKLLVKEGRIFEAKDLVNSYNLSGDIKEILKDIDNEETIRKRKIREIEEYRKKRNIIN